MWLRLIIIIVLLLIAASLFSALYYLVKGDKRDSRVIKALTWRISLSIGLFLVLMLGFYTGIIRHVS
ncbi:MAG: twin transmembrane helix small protein [Methylophilaceae bacterium]